MKGLVVDASVAVKWFVPEIHSEHAAKLLGKGVPLLAPDLIHAEIGNTLLKKWKKGELDANAALGIIEDFNRFPLICTRCSTLSGGAWAVAEKAGITYYDALYAALALLESVPFITADQRLYRALKRNPFKLKAVWVEDVSGS